VAICQDILFSIHTCDITAIAHCHKNHASPLDRSAPNVRFEHPHHTDDSNNPQPTYQNPNAMDYVTNLTGGGNAEKKPETTQAKSGGFMDSINGALGGGKKSEQKEDVLDKGPS